MHDLVVKSTYNLNQSVAVPRLCETNEIARRIDLLTLIRIVENVWSVAIVLSDQHLVLSTYIRVRLRPELHIDLRIWFKLDCVCVV